VLIITLLVLPSSALANGSGEWTWMSGANIHSQAGVYGVRGAPDPANVPSARWGSISWIDGAGNLWLFGGEGIDGNGAWGYLNDLWRYDASGEWTWMSGANTVSQAGVYGVKGTPDPANVPGARRDSTSWVDGAGNLWLFGGAGFDQAGLRGWLNDLWRYDANGEWTWMSGANTIYQFGVYGVQGVPDHANVPGARKDSITWIDGAGNLWLFGGVGYASFNAGGRLNDLWRYDANGVWTWMSGADTGDEIGAYGIKGTPDPANVPGARWGSTSWVDGAGNLWLFGGNGRDDNGNWGRLNDLWRYDANGVWTWMSGSNMAYQRGFYGALGTPDPANVPGARHDSISWIDGAGNLWLFGGSGYDGGGWSGRLNDLWRYDANGEWSWMGGANTVNRAGVYGVLGAPDPANAPGARSDSTSWIDSADNLWLFGGLGRDGDGGGNHHGLLNDLWRYDMIDFSCQHPQEDFENGAPPSGWSVVSNAPGGPVWGDIDSCSPNGSGGNWTGGLGNAACISASTLVAGAYDAELRTPVFSLAGYSGSTISFLLNYQNWGGIDRLDFDLSMDGGATWTTLRTYATDQGAFQSTPGVYVTTDLADYLGEANLMLRWRCHWDSPQALGWYAQVDEAEFKCVQIPPTAVTLASLETGSQVGIGWGWLLAIAASGLALARTLAGRRKGQAGLS
jgi:N-acetylneuraminic acid mutarotase